MPNKITYGLEQVHIALLTDPDTPAWGTPVAIPGAVKFSPAPEGQEAKLYADDTVYFTSVTNDGYKAELEMALIPDTALEDIFGWRIDANGMLVEISDGTPAEFALMGQIQGDAKNRRFVYYRCKAARAAKEHATKGENLEPKTDAISLTIIPITIGAEKVVKSVLELSATNAAVYDAFFDAVVLPDSAAVKTALAAAIALAGALVTPVAQVETATVAGTITTAGNATVTVTAAGMTGSPKAISVAVALSDNAAAIAGKVRTALAADSAVAALFTVSGAGTAVILTRSAPVANDATLNIALADGTCVGVTAAPTSADTTAGVASYTAGSWASMQTALTAANAVNSDPGAVQPEIDAAHAALEAAIVALVPA